jgi:5'-nucleotidase
LVRAAYGARKGVFQMSGLEIELSRCPGHDRVRGLRLPGGRPLSANARYRVALPDFLARGGDGLGSVLAGLPRGRLSLGEDRALNFRDSLVAYWQAQESRELRAPPRGRIRFQDDAATCGNGP